MNFIIRNLEALGDEVAAALDDLADEVTGRNNGNGRCRDGADDEQDGPSDDASDRSVTSGDPQWHGASDAGGSDTASCNSDGGGGICPATAHTPAVPPRPERMSDGPAAAGPSPSTVPVKPPGSGLRRRKAPRIDASKMPAEEGEVSRVEAPAPRPSNPSSSQPRESPPREPPQQTQAPPRDVSAATHSPALDAKPPKPAALGVPPASQQQVQQLPPPAQPDSAKPPAKAPKAVKRRPPVVPPRPTPAPSGTAVAAASAADTPRTPVARAVPPPQPQLPQPPAQTPAKQMHARAPSGSSAFDLCDGSPDGVATPTEDGEYLLL